VRKGIDDTVTQIRQLQQFFSPDNFSIANAIQNVDWNGAFEGLIQAGVNTA
jgi:hypothetical protein